MFSRRPRMYFSAPYAIVALTALALGCDAHRAALPGDASPSERSERDAALPSHEADALAPEDASAGELLTTDAATDAAGADLTPDAASFGSLTTSGGEHSVRDVACAYYEASARLTVRARTSNGSLLTLTFAGIPNTGALSAVPLEGLSTQGPYLNLLQAGESYDSTGSGGTVACAPESGPRYELVDVALRSQSGLTERASGVVICPSGITRPE